MSPPEPPAPPPDPPWAPDPQSPDPAWPTPDAADRVFGGASDASSGYVPVTPLLAADPPKVGEFWLDARLDATPAGIAFTAHDAANTPAMVILLSEGAAADAAARSRFAGEINALHIDTVLARGGQTAVSSRHGQLWSMTARQPRQHRPARSSTQYRSRRFPRRVCQQAPTISSTGSNAYSPGWRASGRFRGPAGSTVRAGERS